MLIQTKYTNPIKNFEVEKTTLQYIGSDLQRPECILTHPNGDLFSADARGGVMQIKPTGEQHLILPNSNEYNEQLNDIIHSEIEGNPTSEIQHPKSNIQHAKSNIQHPKSNIQHPKSFTTRYIKSEGSLPNGICFDENSNFIIANWGTDHIELLQKNGVAKTLLTHIDGKVLGKTNFPLRDKKGRIWFTVTTCTNPWTAQLNTRATDGYIAMIDDKGVRIVADGFSGTNEIRFDDNEEWLYVVESTAWKITRLQVKPNGDLHNRETYGPNKLGGFPDGFAFDAFGNLWITLIFTDQLVALTPDGEEIMLLDDSNEETKKTLFHHYENRSITGEILGSVHGTICPWMSSLSFGGADMKTVYLASLRGTTIPYFKSPVAGQKMIHWL